MRVDGLAALDQLEVQLVVLADEPRVVLAQREELRLRERELLRQFALVIEQRLVALGRGDQVGEQPLSPRKPSEYT